MITIVSSAKPEDTRRLAIYQCLKSVWPKNAKHMPREWVESALDGFRVIEAQPIAGRRRFYAGDKVAGGVTLKEFTGQ